MLFGNKSWRLWHYQCFSTYPLLFHRFLLHLIFDCFYVIANAAILSSFFLRTGLLVKYLSSVLRRLDCIFFLSAFLFSLVMAITAEFKNRWAL